MFHPESVQVVVGTVVGTSSLACLSQIDLSSWDRETIRDIVTIYHNEYLHTLNT